MPEIIVPGYGLDFLNPTPASPDPLGDLNLQIQQELISQLPDDVTSTSPLTERSNGTAY